ncbi:MAG: hypothetical protein AABY22_06790 [Nanoarchaeota archaeon]
MPRFLVKYLIPLPHVCVNNNDDYDVFAYWKLRDQSMPQLFINKSVGTYIYHRLAQHIMLSTWTTFYVFDPAVSFVDTISRRIKRV